MEESEKSDISFWICIYVYSTDAGEKSVKQKTSLVLKAAFSDIHERLFASDWGTTKPKMSSILLLFAGIFLKGNIKP